MSNQQPKRKTQDELARAQMLRGYRLAVEDEELLARMNRATWEKMYYFIEGTKLIPEYADLLKAQDELQKKRIADAETAAKVYQESQAMEEALGAGEVPTSEIPTAELTLAPVSETAE